MENENTYLEVKPSIELEAFVHSFWMHRNSADKPEVMTIFPDSFFKIIFIVQEGLIISYFMTGLWTEQKEFTTPRGASIYGCRLKILAPEYLINKEVASILNSFAQLDLSYLNIRNFDLSDFSKIANQWEQELIKIKPEKHVHENKLRLTQLLDKMKGSISTTQVSDQIYWSNRQINRYLKKHLGITLKKYLNIQKCYDAYLHIREGRFFPEKDYFDQAHYIREVKKHTGETPTSLHNQQNDRFIQLKNIQRK